jgi:hypothetical protein
MRDGVYSGSFYTIAEGSLKHTAGAARFHALAKITEHSVIIRLQKNLDGHTK